MTGKCVLYYIGLFVRPCSLNQTFFTEYISHLTSNPGFSTRQTCFLFTEIITNAFYWRLRNQMTVFLLSFFFSVVLVYCFFCVFCLSLVRCTFWWMRVWSIWRSITFLFLIFIYRPTLREVCCVFLLKRIYNFFFGSIRWTSLLDQSTYDDKG